MAINAEIATRLTVKSSAFTEKMKRAGQSVNKLGTQTTAMGKKMLAASRSMAKMSKTAKIGLVAGFAAAGLAAKKFINLMQETFASVDVLAKVSRTLSISLADMQAFGLGAQLAGLSVEVMNKAITRLAKNVGDIQTGLAQKTILDAFEAIGISADQLQSARPTEVLKLVADGLVGLETKAQKVAIAFALFGRQGPLLLNLLLEGSAGLSKLQRDFQSLGTNISFSQANKIEIANDAFVVLNQRWENFKQNIGAGIADTVTQLFNEIGKALSRLNLDAIVAKVKTIAEISGKETADIIAGRSPTAGGLADVGKMFAGGFAVLGGSMLTLASLPGVPFGNLKGVQRSRERTEAGMALFGRGARGLFGADDFPNAKARSSLFNPGNEFRQGLRDRQNGFLSVTAGKITSEFNEQRDILEDIGKSEVLINRELMQQRRHRLNNELERQAQANKARRQRITENVSDVQEQIDALTNKRLRDLGATGSIGTAGLQRGSLGSLQASIAQVDDRLKRDQEAQILAETERMADLLETIATNTRHPNIELADLN